MDMLIKIFMFMNLLHTVQFYQNFECLFRNPRIVFFSSSCFLRKENLIVAGGLVVVFFSCNIFFLKKVYYSRHLCGRIIYTYDFG